MTTSNAKNIQVELIAGVPFLNFDYDVCNEINGLNRNLSVYPGKKYHLGIARYFNHKKINSIYNQYEKSFEVIKNNFIKTKKLINLHHLPINFSKGDEITFKDDLGEKRGGIIKSVVLHETRTGELYYEIKVNVLTMNDNTYVTRCVSLIVRTLSIGIFHISNDEKLELQQRGILYDSSINKCLQVNGKAKMYYYRVSSIDISSKIFTDQKFVDDTNYQYSNFDGCYLLDEDENDEDENDDEHNSNENIKIKTTADLMWTLPSHIKGFSFNEKKRCLFNLNTLKEPVWNPNVFDILEINPDHKDIILGSIQNYQSSINDKGISNKNDGLIFLLNGPPGIGKTLTAEAVSEYLKKPLYKITIGDLGKNPDYLESNLGTILDRTEKWNAILLIDEADVFLERRSASKMDQNFYVSVFLRLLEYYNGVLFLTSNRGNDIDEAFLSRVTIPIFYENLDSSQRFNIWSNLLEINNINLSEKDRKDIAEIPLNGRQIKNIAKLAIWMSISKNKSLSVSDILKTAKVQIDFRKKLGM